jgi:hypothetical protein
MVARMVLTVIGGAAMIIGAFLSWIQAPAPPGTSTAGTSMSTSIFYSTEDPFGASFFASAGFVAIVLGVVALLGLAFRTGFLTRVAGALGILAIVLYGVTLYRVPDAGLGLGDIGLGAWVVLVGGLLALIGGFMGTRTVATTSAAAPPAP